MMDMYRNRNVIIPTKQPLQINTVVKRIFEFLSLKDIKNCRLVCHKWNSEAELLLRKLAAIRFAYNFRPATFLKYTQGPHLPDIPFTAFKFTGKDNWSITELLDFFNKWGQKVHKLEFDCIRLFDSGNEKNCITRFNIDPFIDLAINLADLKVTSSKVKLVMSSSKLTKVRSLYLNGCGINVNPAEDRIIPQKICLQSVTFHNSSNNEAKLRPVTVNDFLDFRKCSDIKISDTLQENTYFDVSRETFSARKVEFHSISVLNWERSKAKMDFLRLSSCGDIFKEGSQVQVRELHIHNTAIDFDLLPPTITKLKLWVTDPESVDVDIHKPLNLQNLKCLTMYNKRNSPFDIIARFETCSNLVDMELGLAYTWYVDDRHIKLMSLNLDHFPKSLKRVKIEQPKYFGFYGLIYLDVLILHDCSCSLAEEIMRNVKPKVLVLSMSDSGDGVNDDVIDLVFKKNELEKILVALPNPLLNDQRFRETKLSRYVHEKSAHYEFQNQFGRSLTKTEFKKYSSIHES